MEAESSIIEELSERFTHYASGYKYHPSFRNGRWDGKIRLFDKRRKRTYVGLVPSIAELCANRGYELDLDPELEPDPVSLDEARSFIESLSLPPWIEVRDHQVLALATAVGPQGGVPGRGLLISPTSSGKSFIIWLLTRWYQDKRFLIVVPTTALVDQMASDFESYGEDPEEVQKIRGGMEKEVQKRIVVSTWQSIFRQHPDYFEQFDALVGDEAHECAAKSLVGIMEQASNAHLRWGLTGTLDDAKMTEMTLTGLFGPKAVVTTTKKLQEQEIVAQCEVKAILLDYPTEVRKGLRRLKWDYTEELKTTLLRESRVSFVKNLVLSLRGNTMVMFRHIEHGEALHRAISGATERTVHYIDGSTSVKTREELRKFLEEEQDSVAVVSLGTFRRGVNIKNIQNIVSAAPVKGSESVLQSIGRGLRKLPGKVLRVYDLADDLSLKNKRNHTLNHFTRRIGIYAREGFPYKIVRVKIP